MGGLTNEETYLEGAEPRETDTTAEPEQEQPNLTSDQAASDESAQEPAADNVTPIRPDVKEEQEKAGGEPQKLLGRFETEEDLQKYLTDLENYRRETEAAQRQPAQPQQPQPAQAQQPDPVQEYRERFQEEFVRQVEKGDPKELANLLLDVVFDSAQQVPYQVQTILEQQTQQQSQLGRMVEAIKSETDLAPLHGVAQDVVQMGAAMGLESPADWQAWIDYNTKLAGAGGAAVSQQPQTQQAISAQQPGRTVRKRAADGRYMASTDDGGGTPKPPANADEEITKYAKNVIKDLFR